MYYRPACLKYLNLHIYIGCKNIPFFKFLSSFMESLIPNIEWTDAHLSSFHNIISRLVKLFRMLCRVVRPFLNTKALTVCICMLWAVYYILFVEDYSFLGQSRNIPERYVSTKYICSVYSTYTSKYICMYMHVCMYVCLYCKVSHSTYIVW